MPARKSGSSETAPDSRRSSLRRLSSIASFQALFARRRSNNVSDPAATASSSNLSLLSTVANAPEHKSGGASTDNSQGEDSVPDLPPAPQPTHHASRRSSYICLPDDPIGGMPRSRTFSNLPLPTRAKRTTSIIPSKSHARLPSDFFPSSRLPSPPTSTRKHSHTRLASVENKAPLVRNRVKRSDTEPWLSVNGQTSHLPRSTAFKENISLSPIRPLPALDMQDESDWCQHTAHQDLPSSDSLSKYDHPPAASMSGQYQSSPAYRHQQTRSGAEPSFQRWNSQPVLANIVNNNVRRNSQHSEVKQTRLMSTRQPPTPPLPKTPFISSSAMTSGRVKNANNSAHNIRQVSEQTPLLSRSTGPTTRSPSPPRAAPNSILHITAAEPPAYWSGRICALADRYRNVELASHVGGGGGQFRTPPKTQTDKMHTPEAQSARLKQAFEYLHSLCTTQEARYSLAVFQAQFAAVTKIPELAVEVPPSRGTIVLGGSGSSATLGAVGDGLTMSESRKASFMDRLLGRQTKRRSLVLV